MNIYVVDDDPEMRATLALMLEEVGHQVQTFSRGNALLSVAMDLSPGCVLLDLCLPDLDGLTVQAELTEQVSQHSVIMLTGFGDVPEAVTAMRHGALDFLRKPFRLHEMLAALARAQTQLELRLANQRETRHMNTLVDLSRREQDVLRASATGAPSKTVAHLLDLSVRTVEMHRANIIKKLHVPNFGAALLLAQRGGVID